MERDAILAAARDYIGRERHRTFRGEVEELVEREDIKELSDRFYTDLGFGTGGLRGVIGGGYNRMNPFVVRRATQGVANYVRSQVHGEASAVIAYDSRRYSDLFALEAALVLCANGIKTYLFSSLRPTPELSFAVRELKATTGIVVTASHNPPEYNGYKVYWSDGGQIVAPHDAGIVAEARASKGAESISREEALEKGLLVMIDREIDEPFISMVKSQALRPELIQQRGSELTVVFTPLHGTGTMPVSRALGEMGIDVVFVEQQKEPDGDFPTVTYPNPEEPEALAMALDLARRKSADLVLATDPDADRLGIAVRNGDDYTLLSGNQLGALLADYIFSSRRELGTLPQNGAFVKTIVTSQLQRRIADDYGLRSFDTLTGFKYIGEKIRQFESGPEKLQYLFGGEESYGYLVETQVRDKDAVTAATMTAEMALFHRSQGRSLMQQLQEIWQRYGYFEEKLLSRYFKGQEGFTTMNAIMERLRTDPPKHIGQEQVLHVKDYREGTILDIATGTRDKAIALPSSNVLQFILSAGSIVTARPSGTEPKIKLYASCCSGPGEPLDVARSAVKERITAIEEKLQELMAG